MNLSAARNAAYINIRDTINTNPHHTLIDGWTRDDYIKPTTRDPDIDLITTSDTNPTHHAHTHIHLFTQHDHPDSIRDILWHYNDTTATNTRIIVFGALGPNSRTHIEHTIANTPSTTTPHIIDYNHLPEMINHTTEPSS